MPFALISALTALLVLTSQLLFFSDLIVVQSLARANAARNMAKVMRYERNMAAATVIQAKWRTIMTKNHLVNVRRMVVLLQCFVRKTVASMKLEHLKSEKRRFQAEMATRIASAWKKFHCQSAFKRTVRCMCGLSLYICTNRSMSPDHLF